jgi:gamma-resorcylate decarboxylase
MHATAVARGLAKSPVLPGTALNWADLAWRAVGDRPSQSFRTRPGLGRLHRSGCQEACGSFFRVCRRGTPGSVGRRQRSRTRGPRTSLKGALLNGYSHLGTNESVQYLDEEPVREFWERVNMLNIPVYLHPREPLPSQRLRIQCYLELVGSAWAFTYETASHATRLMLSGLFDVCTKRQIILGHLGEGLPYILPRLQHRLDEQFEGVRGAKARKRVSFYFANHFWTTSGHYHTKPFREAVGQVGEDHVLFSVDYPYEQMSAAARWFDEAQFSNSLKLKVGRDNAIRLLRLGLENVSRSAAAAFGA